MIILAEKPKVAKNIAKFLSNNKFRTIKFSKKVYYYFFKKDNENFFVVPALGHLYQLSDLKRKLIFPSFDYKWVPSYIEDKILIKKKYIDMISYLGKKDKKLIIATDFDIEGELIGYNISRFLIKPKEIYRMVFSAITYKDISFSFNNLKEGFFRNFAEAGETRHIIDWIYGINLSRALTYCIRKFDRRITLSIGRVQGPTLKIIFEKEKEIKNFVPEIFYYPYIKVFKDGMILEFKHIKEKFKDKKESKKTIEKIEKFIVVTKILKSLKEIPPPHPYNLTDLQEDAYNFYRISPDRTLKIAQKLYESGYISYPRTSSQKLPETINFREIIKNLAKIKYYRNFCLFLLNFNKLIPNNGKKDDVHPAIHPTGLIPSKLEKKSFLIYDIIVKRFLSTFYPCAIVEKYKIFSNNFFYEYNSIQKKGWLDVYWEFYKDNFKNIKFQEGEKLKIHKKEVKKRKSKGPERYNPSSLVRKMESLDLGTKATRAEIVKILYKRKYIDGNKIKITPIGEKIIEIFEKYIPEILSINMTRKLEKCLYEIERGNLDLKEKVIEESKEIVEKVCEEIKENSEKIGKELYDCFKSLNKK